MVNLEKPMHFTKEQSEWIKQYVIIKKQEAKAEVIEEIKAKAHCEDTECWDCAFGDAEVGCLLKEQNK